MNIIDKCGLTFDDVLLVPRKCDIESRKSVCTRTKFTKNISIDIPIVAANMDSVTESGMMYAMYKLGGVGIMHRFMSIQNTRRQIRAFDKFTRSKNCAVIAVSIGFNDRFDERIAMYDSMNVDVVCIDVAHGHCDKMIGIIKKIRDSYPDIDIIAGNVATREATRDLCEAGADAIKVGIGPGSMCTTRLVTGVGIPQLSAISDCSDVADEYDIPIIADGGIRNSGDIVKAIAAGAETVMIGNLISGTTETPGDVIEDIFEGRKFKRYRGMASNDAMIGWKGTEYHAAPEGESRFVKCKESVAGIIENLVAGLRSGMTYCNARNITELQQNAVFRRVSSNCIMESRPHGL